MQYLSPKAAVIQASNVLLVFSAEIVDISVYQSRSWWCAMCHFKETNRHRLWL